MSETDKEIERRVLFKLLREEEEEATTLRQQQLEVRERGSARALVQVMLV